MCSTASSRVVLDAFLCLFHQGQRWISQGGEERCHISPCGPGMLRIPARPAAPALPRKRRSCQRGLGVFKPAATPYDPAALQETGIPQHPSFPSLIIPSFLKIIMIKKIIIKKNQQQTEGAGAGGRLAALSVCSGERGRAGAVLPPGEAAAAGGGGGGRSSRSGEVSSPPPPRKPSPPNATPRSSQLTARRRAWGAAGPASPLRRRRGVSARCAVLCRAEPCGAGSWGCGAVAAAPRAGAARGAGHVGAAGDGRDAPPQLRPLRRRGWIRGCAAPRGLRQGGRGEAAGVPGDWEGKGRQSSVRPVLAGSCRALRCVCRGLSASAPLNACLMGFFCGKG